MSKCIEWRKYDLSLKFRGPFLYNRAKTERIILNRQTAKPNQVEINKLFCDEKAKKDKNA